jgi:hypothetical protein
VSKDCPQCGLISSSETLRCDCEHTFDSESPPKSAEQQPSALQRCSYLRRHWRGDLSLARSYWLNTVLPTVLVSPAIGLLSLVDVTTHPMGYSLLVIAIWIGLFTITPRQLVGPATVPSVWSPKARSAQKEEKQR